MDMILDEFKNLDRMQQIGMQTKLERDHEHHIPNVFTSMLREMYQDQVYANLIPTETHEICRIPHFSIQKMQDCL